MSTTDGGTSRVAGDIPASQKTALRWVAHDRSTPEHQCSVALLVREAIATFLQDNWDEIPPEAQKELGEGFPEKEIELACRLDS